LWTHPHYGELMATHHSVDSAQTFRNYSVIVNFKVVSTVSSVYSRCNI